MPNSGPVYQPTTVSYEQQGEWRSPSGLLSQTSPSSGRARCLQWVTLGLGILAFVSGIILVCAGSVAISNSESEVLTSDIVILIIGCMLLIIGGVLLAIFIRHGNCRTGCPRLLLKDKRIAHQMRDTQSVNGQAMNPSTDFLVTAQYAPVSEIAYQPPAVSEEEETRKLMGSDNKDCLLKESNSIITLDQGRFEPDDSPELRRVGYYSKTSNNVNESKNSNPSCTDTKTPAASRSTWKNSILRKASIRSKAAPLAGFEDITPSLRSSWSSMYFNQTPSESESEGLSYASDAV